MQKRRENVTVFEHQKTKNKQQQKEKKEKAKRFCFYFCGHGGGGQRSIINEVTSASVFGSLASRRRSKGKGA